MQFQLWLLCSTWKSKSKQLWNIFLNFKSTFTSMSIIDVLGGASRPLFSNPTGVGILSTYFKPLQFIINNSKILFFRERTKLPTTKLMQRTGKLRWEERYLHILIFIVTKVIFMEFLLVLRSRIFVIRLRLKTVLRVPCPAPNLLCSKSTF
jgi:hypothetical protein